MGRRPSVVDPLPHPPQCGPLGRYDNRWPPRPSSPPPLGSAPPSTSPYGHRLPPPAPSANQPGLSPQALLPDSGPSPPVPTPAPLATLGALASSTCRRWHAVGWPATTRMVYSDLTVDYFKMFLLNVPAAVVALTLFFFLDDLTGFEITYLLELPEPFSFIFTWFAALPLIFWVAQAITNAILKDFLILKGPCPNCGKENLSFFGTILSVPSGGAKNSLKCANCGTALVYDSASRLITLPEPAEA